MTSKRKTGLIIVLVLTVLLFIGYLVFNNLNKSSNDEPLGSIEAIKYDLNEAYYLRTEFKDQVFESISDFDLQDGTQFLMYTIPQGLTEDQVNRIGHMYDPNYPPHTIFYETLPKDLYIKITEGKSVFYDTFTLTTVIIPAKVKERGTQGEEYFGYVYSYFEREGVTDIKDLVEISINDANTTSEKRPLLIDSEDEFKAYLKNFTLWEDN